MMMNMYQDIHGVVKVRAKRLSPTNSNALTIEIETEGGILQQTLYFGNGLFEAGKANELFFLLGGKAYEVTGSAAAEQWSRNR